MFIAIIFLSRFFAYGQKAYISVIDTLNKYENADTLLKFANARFYVGNFNKQSIGLVQLKKPSFALYQKVAGKWEITDKFDYPILYVQATDVNGNDLTDIIVSYFFSTAGGNSQNVCLLFNPSSKLFEHNPNYDLSNVQYDKKSNTVVSAIWGGATSAQDKMTYKINGNKLTFKEGVKYIPDYDSGGKNCTIEFYEMQNGKRVVTKTIKGSSEKLSELFDKALWDTGE